MNFKTIFLAFVLIAVTSCATTKFPSKGQCNDLVFDFKTGTLNGVAPTASMDEVKKAFPCFTGDTEEGSAFNCGGGVFFLDHDFFFYTHRDYVEVREDFKGKLTKNVLGLSSSALFDEMGDPDEIFGDTNDLADESLRFFQYETKWGTLVFCQEDGVITEVAFHHGKKPGEIEFCY